MDKNMIYSEQYEFTPSEYSAKCNWNAWFFTLIGMGQIWSESREEDMVGTGGTQWGGADLITISKPSTHIYICETKNPHT